MSTVSFIKKLHRTAALSVMSLNKQIQNEKYHQKNSTISTDLPPYRERTERNSKNYQRSNEQRHELL